jgi:hypothetical protein
MADAAVGRVAFSRASTHRPSRSDPHALDADCKRFDPPMVLPACWR